LGTYARRVRIIEESESLDLLSSQVLSVLQFHALSGPLLPNLQTLELWFTSGSTEEYIPFIPLLLSTKITSIDLIFSGSDLHKATIASMIAALPTLCPNLDRIKIYCLPEDSMITDAVSELVLRTGRNPLLHFVVDAPLTAEACEVIFKQPDLRMLQAVIDGFTALPTIALPNLTDMMISYRDGHDWLQGFCGASFGKLTSITVSSKTDPTDKFLGAFETVALTTSIPATLSTFVYYTGRPWMPDYRSLLPFTQLKELVIESPCDVDCWWTIDDDTITDLARAMPQLELLRLGDYPCDAPAGVTVKGLTALSYHCPHLLDLVIHFQVANLDPAAIPSLASADESTIPRGSCALTFLTAGYIRVPEESTSTVVSALLNIFPHLEQIESFDEEWSNVLLAIRDSRKRIARCSGKKCLFAVA
jgi:hypothetical protein